MVFMVIAHSIIRWVVLVAMVVRLAQGVLGLATKKAWAKADRLGNLVTTIAFDVQLLLGVGLFASSTITKAAMADMGGAMKDSVLRFFTVEHPVFMLMAMVALHLGTALSKKRESHLPVVIGVLIALVLVFAAIPWPFRADIARPLLTLPL